jgi:hypothetical protein
MGRGEHNILFQPPAIRTSKSTLLLTKEINLPGRASEIFLLENKTFVRDKDDVIHHLDSAYKSLEETVAIPKKALFHASRKAIVWGDEDGFIVQNLEDNLRGQFKGLPKQGAEPLSVFVNDNTAYLLWRNKEIGRAFLSSSGIFNDIGWLIIRDYGKNDVKIVCKEKTALVQSTEESEKESLYSFEIIEQKKERGSLRKVSGGSKARSRGKEGALLTTDNGLIWSLSKKEDEEWLLFSSPSHPFFFEDREGRGWQLKDDEYKNLKASGGCAALLLESRLMLFHPQGGKETLFLEKDWEEMSFLDNKILLWKRGSSDALFVDLSHFK